AARNTRLSKTSDNGSGCSADGNLLVESSIYDPFLEKLQSEGGHLCSDDEKQLLLRSLWDDEGHRTTNTIARPAEVIAQIAGFSIPEGKTFLIVKESQIGKQYRFSSEKLSPVLAIFRYSGFDVALEMVRQIYEVGGKGHSCGIYSFDDDHI